MCYATFSIRLSSKPVTHTRDDRPRIIEGPNVQAQALETGDTPRRGQPVPFRRVWSLLCHLQERRQADTPQPVYDRQSARSEILVDKLVKLRRALAGDAATTSSRIVAPKTTGMRTFSRKVTLGSLAAIAPFLAACGKHAFTLPPLKVQVIPFEQRDATITNERNDHHSKIIAYFAARSALTLRITSNASAT